MSKKIVIIQSIYRRHSKHFATTEWHMVYLGKRESEALEKAVGKPVADKDDIKRLYELAYGAGYATWRYLPYSDGYPYFTDRKAVEEFLRTYGYEPMTIAKARRVLKVVKA
jgi:hypothetical protein